MNALIVLFASLALVPMPKKVVELGGTTSNTSVVFKADSSLPAEGYRLKLTDSGAEIAYADGAGKLYAQVTLDQLNDADGNFAKVEIEDWPTYPWRVMLVDGASDFVDKDTVLAVMDAMVLHKMNVMHWHLTEDQSWRIPSKKYPELAKYGRTRPTSERERTKRWRKVAKWIEGDPERVFGPYGYSKEDIAEIRARAKARHIRIVPEIDVPGHVRAVLAAYPEFGCRTEYLATNRAARWQDHGQEYEVLCLGNDAAIQFVMDELDELCELFPDSEVINVGGDEAPLDRWKECPKCQARMKALGFKNERELQGWLSKKMGEHLAKKGRKMSGWAEIVEIPGPDKKMTIPVAWLYPDPGLRKLGRFCPTFDEFTDMGYDIIAGSHKHEYFCQPHAREDDYYPGPKKGYFFPISLEDAYGLNLNVGPPKPGKGRILGTEAFIWSSGCWNFFDIMYKTFPRACAVAELAWGAPEPKDYKNFYERMLVHAKRLRALTIPCGPVDPPGSKRDLPADAVQGPVTAAVKPTVYTHRMDPSKHPDDKRREVKPPDLTNLGEDTHFMALRHASGPNLKRYIDEDKLGDFVWPYWGYLLRDERQLRNFIGEMKKRGLYIFDVYAMIVGNGNRNAGSHQFHLPDWAKRILKEEYDDHWLGMDNGEQDGAYIAKDARGVEPMNRSRFAQYQPFQRYFEYMDLILGNKIATLVSLTYGHYFLRENCYTMIGAETAQMLPNAQIYYSFIRGAGKQYGVPWFGNASTFSRWGYKNYPKNPKDEDLGKFRRPHPLNGASLALLKKLMVAQIMYNSSAVGFEFGYYYDSGGETVTNTKLSPIGEVHKSCQKWCADHGTPGVMHTPVAVMFDFLSGWTYSRHNYAGHTTYRVWGALDYDEGDFLAHGVLEMLYPHYPNSGWWHDENGFNCDTPYGDIADCLLTDAPAWLLDQYGCIVLVTKIEPRLDTADKLRRYVANGGHLVLPEGNVKRLFPDGFGATGKGRVTLLPGGEWGVSPVPLCKLPTQAENDEEVANPRPLVPEARAALDAAFRGQMIFGTSKTPLENGLSIVTCRRKKNEYTVAVLNNTWEEKPFEIVSFVGRIAKIEELAMARPERKDPGYVPYIEGWKPEVGEDTEKTIAGGSVRTLRVTLEAEDVREIPELVPPPNPTGRFLFVRDLNGAIGPVKEAIFRRPSFFQQYDGVMLDWRYLWSRSMDDIREQANWIGLQQLKIAVDLGSGLNLFPDMRLLTNDGYETERTARRFDDLLEKMEILGAKTMVLAPHNDGGGLMKGEAEEQRNAVIRNLCRKAAAKGITVYFRSVYYRRFQRWPMKELERIVGEVNDPNFKIAPVLGFEAMDTGDDIVKAAKRIAASKAELVYLAFPETGATGHIDAPFGRLAACSKRAEVEKALAVLKASGKTFVFAALCDTPDDEYRELKLFGD